MTPKLLQDVVEWFKDRPKWMQDAAHRLALNGTLTEQDHEALLSICLAEINQTKVAFSEVSTSTLSVNDITKALRLQSITNLQGINALSPSKPLDFGDAPLCIVYGRNGAGKSGYVRLLKHTCGVKKPGELLGNVFKSNSQSKSATFNFSDDAESKSISWSGQPLSELRGVDIYDTICGHVYVTDENEVAFEPWLLRFFTHLTRACEALSGCIQSHIQASVSSKALLPQEYASLPAGTWYSNLTANTKVSEIESFTNWTQEHETELADAVKRLTEANPALKGAALRRQKTNISNLLSYLKDLHAKFSDEKCNSYLQIKADAKSKRLAADQDAKKVFEKALLAEVGSESWRLLWDAARTYSTQHAYKEVGFPNTTKDARCVLCQQELDQASRDRFQAFEAFVKGELQKQVQEAEKVLKTKVTDFPEIPSSDSLNLRFQAANIVDENDKSIISEFVTSIAKRKETCLAAVRMSEISILPKKSLLAATAKLARDLLRQARIHEKDAKNENRPQLEKLRKELSARRWLNQQKQIIQSEIARLVTIQKLKSAEALTTTTALSRKKSSLAEELITNAYVERFKAELKELRADQLLVELKKTRAEVGRVYHQIVLRNALIPAKTATVLSEGEFRIISLAAFLADSEGRGAKTPFIFDDPISSLDQVYEEATAKRLVRLSQSRQVIVFTHRLSLIGSIEKYSDKDKLKVEIICLSNYTPGEIIELPIDLKRTDRAANTLLNQSLSSAKKALAKGDSDYETEAKRLCRDIRVLIERIVEMDLLNGIVRRHNPEVHTKQIHSLAKITEADCKFVDGYMTKYSSYEHSQSEETPVIFPKPDEIETDLKAIVGFIENMRNRRS